MSDLPKASFGEIADALVSLHGLIDENGKNVRLIWVGEPVFEAIISGLRLLHSQGVVPAVRPDAVH
ncbi:hypothetical protein BJ122_102251 [Rhodopseudomonas faecalis]|uniref:Uncharacterized protein n=1 Tax=Rhodopseudomonas faecalis TaxID=99655 RepID=A0A318TT53_9BRAD|nr:hypothetical protein [Rhodopseudomonas faecalis]PYF05025.1 hypothetical protein BJ122_102251 [Rhodopseudomonas faecalis]